jgi:hypothetical protein
MDLEEHVAEQDMLVVARATPILSPLWELTGSTGKAQLRRAELPVLWLAAGVRGEVRLIRICDLSFRGLHASAWRVAPPPRDRRVGPGTLRAIGHVTDLARLGRPSRRARACRYNKYTRSVVVSPAIRATGRVTSRRPATVSDAELEAEPRRRAHAQRTIAVIAAGARPGRHISARAHRDATERTVSVRSVRAADTDYEQAPSV